MPVYAKGKKAVAICDRSGFRVPYKNLRTEWTGFRVAPDEYEPKNPQLTPPTNIIDATALFKPRPDNDPENIIINLQFDWFDFNKATEDADGFTQRSLDSTTYKRPNQTVGKGSVGRVSIEMPIEITATGLAGTGAVGTETPEASITETGVAGTGAVGTETFETSITETGVAGTGAIGTEALTASVTETGLAGTGAIGTYGVVEDHNRWGEGAWGEGAWGIDERHTQIDITGLAGTGAIGTVSIIIGDEWGLGLWGEGAWGQ
jgi:hypothetical protein